MNNNDQYANGAVNNNIAATPTTPNRNEDTPTTPRSRYIPPHLRNKTPCSTPAINTVAKNINTEGFIPRDNRAERAVVNPGGLLPRDNRTERELFPSASALPTFIYERHHVDVPVKVFGDDVPKPIERFEDVDLGPVITNNIGLSQITSITPIQKYVVPVILAGRDLMACAQTGSGKTNSYLFPIISKLSQANQMPRTLTKKATPLCLILTPVRELTIGIHHEASKFSYRSHLKTCVVYGGAEVRTQIKELERGCDILVATPGRLIDLVDRGKISLANLKYLCIDEVDRLLDMGFEPQIRRLVEEMDMPAVSARQTYFFSATFPREVQRLAQDFMYDYILVQVGRSQLHTYGEVNARTQKIVYADEDDKRDTLIELLGGCLDGLTLIYVNTKRRAEEVDQYLFANDFPSTCIHGDRNQLEREEALAMFRSGRKPILVATDISARGLEIPSAAHVINYDLPHDIDSYVHRVGRTGHVCSNSSSISLFSENDGANIAHYLVDILEENNQEVPDWLREYAAANRANLADRQGRGVRGIHGGCSGSGRGRGGRGGYGVSATRGYADTRALLRGQSDANDSGRTSYSKSNVGSNGVSTRGGYGSNSNRDNWW